MLIFVCLCVWSKLADCTFIHFVEYSLWGGLYGI